MPSEIELTEFEKHIYNTHLRFSRKQKNQPFRARKDFSDIQDKNFIYLKKISAFLTKHSHIKLEDFIYAPFNIYPDEQYFDLSYFTTLKAVKAYTTFKKKQDNLDPDTPEQLQTIIESLKFINTFCRQQNINVPDYINYKPENTHSFIIHLKEHKINTYSLFGFSNFERVLRQYDMEMIKFILSEDFINNLPTFRLRYFASKKAKKLVDLGLKKITS